MEKLTEAQEMFRASYSKDIHPLDGIRITHQRRGECDVREEHCTMTEARGDSPALSIEDSPPRTCPLGFASFRQVSNDALTGIELQKNDDIKEKAYQKVSFDYAVFDHLQNEAVADDVS